MTDPAHSDFYGGTWDDIVWWRARAFAMARAIRMYDTCGVFVNTAAERVRIKRAGRIASMDVLSHAE